MLSMNTILILSEDDALVSTLQKVYEERKAIQVICVDYDELLAVVAEKPGELLLVLDMDYPEFDLYFVMRYVPPDSEKLIILICSDVDAVKGIRAGRDDFILKPYRLHEVIARLDNSLARFRVREEHNIEAGQLVINLRERKVFERGREIVLTVREFDLLVLLAKNPGRVFSREQIYTHVWGDDTNYYDRNLMSFVSKLRKKLEPDINNPKYLMTHWGYGYYFNGNI